MRNVVTKEEIALLIEISKDPVAYEALKAKCQWELMSQSAVLRCWGDPRGWKSVKAAQLAAQPTPDCTEPNRAICPRLCHDFCNKYETEKAAKEGK